jgi:non-specific protein-tyrosine kinase
VFDAPSAATFSDAAVLASQVDGVVMVVRANQAIREAERRTRELFVKVGANVVGAVLNEAPAQDVDSYYFHHHYYGAPPALPPQASGPEPAALSATSSAATASATVVEKPEAAPAVQATSAPAAVPAPAAPVARPAPVRPAPRVRRPPQAETGARKPRVQSARRPARASASRPLPRWLVRGVIALAGVLVVLAVVLGYSQFRTRPARSGSATPVAPAAAGSAAVNVTAVVKFPTDVRVERDGKLLYEGPLTAGQQIWQGSREVTVWASQPDAIELTVNGKSVGTLGREGDPPTSRRFTAEGRSQ